MRHTKGFILKYGVSSYTRSDFSSARSLFKYWPKVVTIYSNEKNEHQLITRWCFYIHTYWVTPNVWKLGIYSFLYVH